MKQQLHLLRCRAFNQARKRQQLAELRTFVTPLGKRTLTQQQISPLAVATVSRPQTLATPWRRAIQDSGMRDSDIKRLMALVNRLALAVRSEPRA